MKSQFGYHVVQVEERQAAHAQSLGEVQHTIKATLSRQTVSQAEENYAQAAHRSEAVKNGLDRTAAAHHLEVVTTPSGRRAAEPSPRCPTARSSSPRPSRPSRAIRRSSRPPAKAMPSSRSPAFEPAHAPTFADWKSHVLDDYRRRAASRAADPEDQGAGRQGQGCNDLAKAAKEVGATVKTSDLVGQSGQVPDFGEVGQVAPQLFDLPVGNISGPINAGRTGVVAKLIDKQEPTDARYPEELRPDPRPASLTSAATKRLNCSPAT